MHAGTETALARVVAVFGAAKPHCAYLFAKRRARTNGAINLVDTSLTLYTMQSSAKPVAFGGKDWRRNPGDG